jgi:hypothetical protein
MVLIIKEIEGNYKGENLALVVTSARFIAQSA